jgi:hypothetical protein
MAENRKPTKLGTQEEKRMLQSIMAQMPNFYLKQHRITLASPLQDVTQTLLNTPPPAATPTGSQLQTPSSQLKPTSSQLRQYAAALHPRQQPSKPQTQPPSSWRATRHTARASASAAAAAAMASELMDVL